MTFRTALAPLFLASFCLLLACPHKDEAVDGGQGGGEGGNEDAGDDAGVDGGFHCRIDDDCEILARANSDWKGLRCDNDLSYTGSINDGGAPSFTCIPGTLCNDDNDCQSLDFDNYCFLGTANGKGCRCVLEGLPDAGGVCRQRKPACTPCTSDSECGDNGSYFEPIGACRPLQGGSTSQTYCFQQGPTCPTGYILDQNGYCIPQSLSCETAGGCTVDTDCQGGEICNTENGLCVQRCRWNFTQHQTQPECGPGRSCWVDEQNLDPTSSRFGSGRCKLTCSNSSDCAYGGTFPDGGQKLKCAGELVPGSADSPNRCRPNGECMDDSECPDPGVNIPSKGYCDRATFSCQQDCRIGDDPLTGNPYADCKVGYDCRKQGNVNACVQLTCAEFNNVNLACSKSQFCDGEDRNLDGVPDHADAGTVKDAIGCYEMPMPPYCQTCSNDLDCVQYIAPSMSSLPALCVYAGDKMQQGDGVSMCMLGAANDFTRLDGGAIVANKFCPAGWNAQGERIDLLANSTDNCNTDADCQLGHPGDTSAVCAQDVKLKLSDGGFAKTCFCSHPGPDDCPNDSDAGVYSFCLAGNFPSVCVSSVVCEPAPGYAYKTVANGGCGL